MTTKYGNILWTIGKLVPNTIETNKVTHIKHVYKLFLILLCVLNLDSYDKNVLQHAYTLKDIFYIPTIFAITIFIVPHDNQSITIGYSCTFNYIKIAIIVVWFFHFKSIFNPNFEIVKSNCRFPRCSLHLVFSIFKFFGLNFNTFFQIQETRSLFKNRSNSMYTPHTPKC